MITDLPNELISALSQGLSQFGINLPPMPTGLLTGTGATAPTTLTSPGLGMSPLTTPGLGTAPLTTPGLGTTPLTTPGLTTTPLTTPGVDLAPATVPGLGVTPVHGADRHAVDEPSADPAVAERGADQPVPPMRRV